MHTHSTLPARRTLDIPEVAALLGISSASAYALARQNRLPVPVIRVGKRLLVSRVAVEQLIQGSDRAVQAPPHDGSPYPERAPGVKSDPQE
jgi:predicted DNA-binding transcriptional regulator AlpA